MTHQHNDDTTEQANTGGSTYVGRDVRAGGDFVGHDQNIHSDMVHGDKVGGDSLSVTVGNNAQFLAAGKDVQQTIYYVQPPKNERERRNRETMLKLVTSFWIDGVLTNSLYKEVLIELGLEQNFDYVAKHPWETIVQIPGERNKVLPHGTKLIDVFNDMNRQMLILGEPGSGKTTMLLELAKSAIEEAEQDETKPIPVVFNLSSWADKREPLEQWLVDELRTKYNIPKKVAQAWVKNDAIMPLVDGLDEVSREHRQECVQAINTYRRERFIALAVCSRISDYKGIGSYLQLNGSIVAQPLDEDEIIRFLQDTFGDMNVLYPLLRHHEVFKELAKTPLILNITAAAYDSLSMDDLEQLDSVEKRRKHVFDNYIRRMFQRRGRDYMYPPLQTIHYLKWLAEKMAGNAQTVFQIERMQPNWVKGQIQNTILILMLTLTWGLLYGVLIGLLNGFVASLIYSVLNRLIGISLTGLFFDLPVALFESLRYGLIVGIIAVSIESIGRTILEIRTVEHPVLSWRMTNLYVALYWGVVYYLFFVARASIYNGQISGGLGSLLFGIIGGVTGTLVSQYIKVQPAIIHNRSWDKMKMIRDLIAGVFSGLLVGLFIITISSQGIPLGEALALSLVTIVPISLIAGIVFGLIFEQGADKELSNVLVVQKPNHRIWMSLRSTLTMPIIVNLSISAFFMMIFGIWAMIYHATVEYLQSVLSLSIALGRQTGLRCGPISGIISGGDVVIKHFILRLILWWKGYTPWNYARFLDYCHDRIFLRKVGSGYIFIHRMLMEHFASLTDEDIECIVASVEQR